MSNMRTNTTNTALIIDELKANMPPLPTYAINTLAEAKEWLSKVQEESIFRVLRNIEHISELGDYFRPESPAYKKKINDIIHVIKSYGGAEIFRPIILNGSEWRQLIKLSPDGNEELGVGDLFIDSYSYTTVEGGFYSGSMKDDALYVIEFMVMPDHINVGWQLRRLDKYSLCPITSLLEEGSAVVAEEFVGSTDKFKKAFAEWQGR